MNPELLERLRAELNTERETVLAELAELGADPYSEKVDHIAGVDDNFADSAAATAERGEQLAFIDSGRERLGDIDTALAQMDAGKYGECVDCGQEIPTARLEARPLSIRCVECAAKRE